MRNVFIRILYGVVLFFAAFCLMEILAGGSSTQTTGEMEDAVLPVVYMETGSTVFNPMQGFTGDHDPGEDRFTLTPISSDRRVSVRIDMKGGTLISAKAEARNIGGDRLIESEELSPAAASDGTDGILEGEASFSNLMEEDQEYLLVLVVEGKSSAGRNYSARYYTRVLWTADNAALTQAQSALSFVQQFHTATFDKTRQDELLTWLEPDDSADNSTFSSVTIHSSVDQVTWGDLNPQETAQPVFSIQDIENGTIEIQGNYYVNTEPAQGEDAGAEYLYSVTESYELRQGKDRFYLMNYDRTMDQIFDPENPQGTDGNLDLGITDASVDEVMSGNGDTVAFVQNGRLYAVQASEKIMAYLYGFGDPGSMDERDRLDQHGIRILDVTEDGSVDFLVYGYMNAGRHEGGIGVSFYHYSGEHHTLEEKVYIPYEGGWEVLRWRVRECSYYNPDTGKLYLLLNDRLVEADVNACTIRTVADGLTAKKAVFSENGQMAAYENWENGEAAGEIILLDLASLSEQTISVDGSSAVPLGFLGEDLIYGAYRPEDVVTDRLGTSLVPMYQIVIADSARNVLEDYHPDGYWVTGIEVEDNQVTLNRVQKGSDGSYTAASDDQIVSGEEERAEESVQTTVTDRYEMTVQVPTEADLTSLRYIRPEEILYEGSRELAVREADTAMEHDAEAGVSSENAAGDEKMLAAAGRLYFAWKGCELISVDTDIRESIEDASAADTGVVTNESGCYLWKGSEPDRSEIDALTSMNDGSAGRDSMEVCLETLLSLEGTSGDAAEGLENGKTAVEILREALPDADILDLSGCEMSDVLYYVGEHIPVLALTEGGSAVLMVGYGPENVELYDPAAGSVHLAARDTAGRIFKAAGNRFVTVIPGS